MILKAKNYLTRKDLELAVKSEFGQDIIINREAGHKISGTRGELQKLNLDDTTEFLGVKCVITDLTTRQKLTNKKNERR